MEEKNDIPKKQKRLQELRNRFKSTQDTGSGEKFTDRLKGQLQSGDRSGRFMQSQGGGRGEKGQQMRKKILKFLTNTSPGDELIQGTNVSQQNLERFVAFLHKSESSEKMANLTRPMLETLAPEDDGGKLKFDPDKVNKFLSMLEAGPRQGAGLRQQGGAIKQALKSPVDAENMPSTEGIQQTLQLLEKLVQKSSDQIKTTQEMIAELHDMKLTQQKINSSSSKKLTKKPTPKKK